MYQIAICDDDVKILEQLHTVIKETLLSLNVKCEYYTTHDPKALLSFISGRNIDLLFLDIDMPIINGMDIAEYLVSQNSKTLLIFVTQHDSLVYQSFKYHPFGFLRKSYFVEEIEQVATAAVKSLKDREDSITIKVNGEFLILRLDDIVYIEASSNYVNITTKSSAYQYRQTLGELEQQLSSKGFIRIHKGFIVNSRYVYALSHNEIKLTTGQNLPVGRSNRDNVRSQIIKYMR